MSAPIPFPHAAGVPILGQKATIASWFPTILTVCLSCESHPPFFIIGLTGVGECPVCHARWTPALIHHDGRTGDGRLELSQVATPAPVVA